MRLFSDIRLVSAGGFVWDAHGDEPHLQSGQQIQLSEIVSRFQGQLFHQLDACVWDVILHGVDQFLDFRRQISVFFSELLKRPIQRQIDLVQHKNNESI